MLCLSFLSLFLIYWLLELKFTILPEPGKIDALNLRDFQTKSAIDSNKLQVVRHEAAQEMRVWPLGVGLQEQASKHLKLLWSKAMVMSVEEKVPLYGISCGSERRAQANHPMRCRKIKDDIKTGGHLYTRISPGETCLLPGWRLA